MPSSEISAGAKHQIREKYTIWACSGEKFNYFMIKKIKIKMSKFYYWA